MAFESLSEKLSGVFKKLRGKGVLTEQDINDAMREVKLALLEADVNYKVVKEFVADVKEKALGEEVLKSLTPAQQVVKIVNDELVALMGGGSSKLTYSPSGFTTILMVGLQGTGKTTTCAKLASYLKKQGKHPMLAACDVQRPAAIDQLEVVGGQVDVPVFCDRTSKDPTDIALRAKKEAERKGLDMLIVDTAGRLHVDEALMEELKEVKKAVKPHEILLVVDAMTGQDAVTAAEAFHEAMGIDGIVMTKLDGDTRGGAALSVKKVTGRPIKFIGMGEKLD
ncbi:MAG: signal recognition particle protein, partial [Firmicutes bacterium]|nr:signal recognition particle protein [Bacillota bacterium]